MRVGDEYGNWWMSLRGQIDDRLLEKIKEIDEDPEKIEETGARNQNEQIFLFCKIIMKKLVNK